LVFVIVAALAGVVTTKASALAFIQGDPCADTKPLFVCPEGTVGASYSITLKAEKGNGPPYSYLLTNGALPPGLQLSSAGPITGRPTRAGRYSFWVEARDNDDDCLTFTPSKCAQREFSINVLAGVSINNQSVKGGTLGQPYSEQLAATLVTESPAPAGSPLANATWTVQSGALPPGVTLSATGLLSGTPTTEGTYTFVAKAALDPSRFDTETLTIDVRSAVAITSTPAQVPKSEIGVAFKLALAASGGTGTYTWALEGTLPSGVVFNPTTATFSGTPRAAGAFSFTATATDQGGRTATYPGRILVAQKLAITRPQLKPAKVGRLWALKLRSTGGVLPKTWKLTKGPLPKGIKFDKTRGVFSGKAVKAGRYRVTVELRDDLKVKSTLTFTIVVLPDS
jgi:hypothetical protein